MANVLTRITEALDEKATVREDLVALGIVVTGVIYTARIEDRAALVDAFCSTLRKALTTNMN